MGKIGLLILYVLAIAGTYFAGQVFGFWGAVFVILVLIGGFFIFKIQGKAEMDVFYAKVASEMSDSDYKPDLMAKAVADSEGNAGKARSLYVKYRAERLRVEAGEVRANIRRGKILEGTKAFLILAVTVLLVRGVGYLNNRRPITQVENKNIPEVETNRPEYQNYYNEIRAIIRDAAFAAYNTLEMGDVGLSICIKNDGAMKSVLLNNELTTASDALSSDILFAIMRIQKYPPFPLVMQKYPELTFNVTFAMQYKEE